MKRQEFIKYITKHFNFTVRIVMRINKLSMGVAAQFSIITTLSIYKRKTVNKYRNEFLISLFKIKGDRFSYN